MPLETASQSPVTTIVLLVAMAAVFYFLMIRPQRRRAKQQQEALAALQPGVRVLLGSGFYATLLEMRDTDADVELAPGLVVTVVRQAIVRAVPETDVAATEPAEELEPTEEVVTEESVVDEPLDGRSDDPRHDTDDPRYGGPSDRRPQA